ncbi:phosphoserine phosphatase SerB [Lutibaculum baratangense]|uniref:Phosphoserine phosphatase n=1 Tax=Lutibaculum baratangense AMV1 TaxID=631454 RepID=V4RMP2_9HYPH|nr:phosphoserine phosphatase SerB [Lutibaculum baratangense]ESR27296.1 Phosphoserine phosphatase [Lutibaculum baratangense AMV1]
MPSVIVLTGNPAEAALDSSIVDRLARDIGIGARRWLMPRVAAEFAVDDGTGSLEEARAAVADLPIDANLIPAEGRRKRLLLADMDSTIIGQECIDELADLVGIKTEIAGITERAMRGEIEFEPALRERVALLKGLDLRRIGELLGERISLNPGARTLVTTMRKAGAYTALVSGGFTHFTSVIADRAGFDENSANRLLIEGEFLTGVVEEPILGRAAKRERLEALLRERSLRSDAAIVVGDGANDLDMIRAAGLGVAYHAKPAVAAAAHARIDHGDLTALLFLQGYSQDEFAEG